ncbi:MAG: TlpA disulfide reductase family protein [Chitinophagales bacterium]|nr:TlpA family protein disulfide reductase [Chitinophagales bacterium]MDW8394213.1 TlpA disulfide reductase family protein [Chitinophagales bacterium]
MTKHPAALIVFLLLASVLHAAKVSAQVDIGIRIMHLPTDTVWFGRTWGKKAIPLFYAVKNADGFARLQSDTFLAPGIYALMYKRGRHARYTFFSCLLDKESRRWTVETLVDKPYSRALISGNFLNESYVKYYDAFQTRLRLLDSLNDLWRLTQSAASFDSLVVWEQSLRRYQLSVQAAHAGTLLDTVVQWTLLPDGRTWLNSDQPLEERRRLRESAYHQAALAAASSRDVHRKMSCPLWMDWLDLTVFKLYNNPADAQQFAEALLQALQPYPEAVQYYFSYLMYSFAHMTRFSMDEVFYYLYTTYVKTGRANWLDEENRQKLADLAAWMPGTLTGDRARDANLQDRYGRPVRLDTLFRRYTLLIFWDPECHHCRKELPILRELADPYLPKGLRIVTVCMAKGPRLPECWAFVDSVHLPASWIYLSEPDAKPALHRLYNLRSFPKWYLMDAEKKIVYRRTGEVPDWELQVILQRFVGT